MRRRQAHALSVRTIVVAIVLAAAGCGGTGGTLVDTADMPLVLRRWGPQTILPGTVLRIEGEGFVSPSQGVHAVWLRPAEGAAFDGQVLVEAEWVSETVLRVPIGDALAEVLAPRDAPYPMRLRVTRTLLDGATRWVETPVSVHRADTLVPRIDALVPTVWFPGDVVVVEGDGFLLEGEGSTELVFDGVFAPEGLPTPTSIAGRTLVPYAVTRTRMTFTVGPDLFGVRPGHWSGQLRVRNHHKGGTTTEGQGIDALDVPLARPYADAVLPSAVRRGQVLRITGRGFVAPQADPPATTLVVVEGAFVHADGRKEILAGDTALTLYPDAAVGNTELQYVLRVLPGLDGRPTGLGLDAGVLDGTATPWLVYDGQLVQGLPTPVHVTVLHPLQVVVLKYLPAFHDALEAFGLAAVEADVRQRILQVVHRDYAGINIQFVEQIPDDFVEYSIVEIGGEDPNGAHLFGLDNTEGKDVGNLRFNDVIGGLNATTAEQGYYAYGGIFVLSLFALSPTLAPSTTPLADPRFDAIFGPFVPALGGEPVTEDEYPGGPRHAAIAEAIRVLGNLVGNTITHEVGHTLGLAAIEGQFHNTGDNPNWIMDAGIFRSFGERAEVDGEGPEVFAPFNLAYLQSILPVD